MTRAALLVGATGLVGGRCLARLLDDPTWDRVRVLTRRPTGVTHPRLDEVVTDLDPARLAASEPVACDDLLCCLGTTIRTAGSQAAFRRVDHDLVVEVARLARRGGARRAALVSSVGADPSSWNFYLRTKGEAEREVAALGFECVEVLRPSFLVGERAERRRGEALGIAASSALAGLFVGPTRRYRPIEADAVARAMLAALKGAAPGVHVREFDALMALAGPAGSDRPAP